MDVEQTKSIAKIFLEQYHNVANINVDLKGSTWKVLVDTFQEQIEVSLNAEDGRILGFTFLKGKR